MQFLFIQSLLCRLLYMLFMGEFMSTLLLSMMNTQIQKEFEAAYIYLGLAIFFDKKGLSGFSKWYKKQAKEEEEHAMKIYDFLCNVQQPIELLPLAAPKNKIETIEQALIQASEHEEYISNLIGTLYFQAEKEKDLFTQKFLEWFISEQLEEERNAKNLIEKFKNFGSTPEGLYSLDRELANHAKKHISYC